MSAVISFVLGSIRLNLWGSESGSLQAWGDASGYIQIWGDAQ